MMPLNLDTWPVKISLLVILLALRYAAFRCRPRSPRALYWIQGSRELLDSACVTLGVVFLLLQPFIAQAFYIPTGSMENTLPPGDRILTSKLAYRVGQPHYGDVVVFEAPPAALADSGQPQGTFFVKRCIGAPGEQVELRNQTLFRSGVAVREPYTRWKDMASEPRFAYDMKIVGAAIYARQYDSGTGLPGPWTKNDVIVPQADQIFISQAPAGRVPPDCYLMLGDHRNQSLDGHIWGFVPRRNVIGKAFAVFWPLQHIGVVDRKSGF